jgi:endonuclease/exonuclease/phosphatase family metal-dependent hydrolase
MRAVPVDPADEYAVFQGVQLAPLRTTEECRQLLSAIDQEAGQEMDSPNIQLLTWNIKKGEERNWERDLERFSVSKHLVLLQESAFSMRLGTAKSTNITQYALTDTDQDLLVVNIHAFNFNFNFSFGLVTYRAQLDAVADVLPDHVGPVSVAGDLNTWRPGRLDALLASLKGLGLETVHFGEDLRRKAFGLPLDYVFVRGLSIEEASAFDVSSSDHNPMTASFSLSQSQVRTGSEGL